MLKNSIMNRRGDQALPPASMLKRVLLISNDVIGEKMAGPGIRFWEFAKALSKAHKVTLAVPNRNPPLSSGFDVCTYVYKGRELQELARNADAIVFQGFVLHLHPFLRELDVPLVVDIYDPFVLENIQVYSHNRSMGERMMLHGNDLDVLNDQLKAGDFFICASEKQRDFWIGMLLALGRVNPHTYDDDETLQKLIAVVPFGIPSEPPAHTKLVLKGVHKTIRERDRVILWGGGIWDWFDPCTLIRAMARIAEQRDDVKLFFMGVKHPNPLIPEMKGTTEAIPLSKELGLYDEFIFFNEWVPYKERQNYLLEADVGVSLHLDHIETRLSFRTRLLDYIWAGLPIVTTRGDCMSELVEQYDLGKVVDYEDVEQVTETLLELLDTPDLREAYRPNFEKVRDQFTWERVVDPLTNFCANPHFAPDRGALGSRRQSAYPGQGAIGLTPWWLLPGRAWRVFRHGGLRTLYKYTRTYLQLKLGGPIRSAGQDDSGV